jgi:RNA polymerase sigma-70 factor (sigma-E family)
VDVGDEAYASFSAWAASRQDHLLRAAYLLTGDHHRAEDLLQDALIKVARRWHRLRDGNPEAYARRVIYHSHVSWWRRRRETPVEEIHGQRLGHAEATERGIVLEQALARLTAKQRKVIVARYVDDLSERQTAELLGVSLGTVKSQTSAAVRRLRDEAPELVELRVWEDGRS